MTSAERFRRAGMLRVGQHPVRLGDGAAVRFPPGGPAWRARGAGATTT